MKRLLHLFGKDEFGSNAIEYGLVLAFVAVAIIMSISKVNTPLTAIMKGWGPDPKKKTTQVTTADPTLSFQNLTQSDIKKLYDKYEGQDKSKGISTSEWSGVYESVTGSKPGKSDVLKTFEATDGAKGKGGNADGILSYSEFKAATLFNTY